jgi:hypothetical protein
LTIHDSGLVDTDESLGAEEGVVPAQELGVDCVVVVDKLSIADACEVKVGVKSSNLLLNNVKNLIDVDTFLVGVGSSHTEILLISSEPCSDIVEGIESISFPCSPWEVDLRPGGLQSHV